MNVCKEFVRRIGQAANAFHKSAASTNVVSICAAGSAEGYGVRKLRRAHTSAVFIMGGASLFVALRNRLIPLDGVRGLRSSGSVARLGTARTAQRRTETG